MAERPPNLRRPASAVLELVCARCVGELGMADASVGLASSDGLWTPAYATSATAAGLEQQAFTIGEGPCYEALHRHAPVLTGDLDSRAEENRWPVWSPFARAAGVRSVAALPVQAGAIAAGVLTVFSPEVGALSGARLTLALRLADIALLGLLDVLADSDDAAAGSTVSAAALDGAQFANVANVADVVRAEVHQAAGMIMVQAGIPIAEALARLRARAFQTGRPITELAKDVLARRIRFTTNGDSAE